MKQITGRLLFSATLAAFSVTLNPMGSEAKPGVEHHTHDLPKVTESPTPGNSESHEHHHKTLAIPAGQPVPMVKLVAHLDAMQGWNLEVQVTNFRFAPEQINRKSLTTEGHAHLYIDGKKVTRLYGSWYYLANLEPGQHQITVTLNANGHEELTFNGQSIAASTIVHVPVKRE